MSDLISRQDTIDRINEYIEEYSEIDSDGNHSEKWCAMQEAKMTIENMPSAQPEIIRCKDCRFATLTYDGDCKYCQYLEGEFGLTDAVYFDGNDYCSHAERRTNE